MLVICVVMFLHPLCTVFFKQVALSGLLVKPFLNNQKSEIAGQGSLECDLSHQYATMNSAPHAAKRLVMASMGTCPPDKP